MSSRKTIIKEEKVDPKTSSRRTTTKESKVVDNKTNNNDQKEAGSRASQKQRGKSKAGSKVANKKPAQQDDRLSDLPIAKKLISTAEKAAMEAAEGFVLMHKDVRLLGSTRNVVRADISDLKGKVAVISGGGSGHEPFAIGNAITSV
jgi:hypothetical protein